MVIFTRRVPTASELLRFRLFAIFCYTVKPHNSGLLCQQEFFHYCGVFHYFEGSFSINGHFGHLGFSTIEGFSTILTSAIAGLYCTCNKVLQAILPTYAKLARYILSV